MAGIPQPGAVEHTTLVLVRHGEAVCNVERRAGGQQGCRGLSDNGRRQAEALRDRLARTREVRPHALYTSTLPRAIETAEIVAPAVGGLEPVQDPDLCELDPGGYDGWTWEEIDAALGPIDISIDPFRRLGPGAESWASFQLRVGTILSRLVEQHRGETVLIVAHGGIVDGALSIWFRMDPLAVRTTNASLTTIVREAKAGRPPRWLLRAYNDAAHLEGIPTASGYPDPGPD